MDLDTVDHLLTTTRSIRKRLDFTRPVEPAVIERCIETALHSPSGGNNQGWHFMVVTDPEKRVAIADLYRKAHKNLRDIRGDQPPWRPGDLRVVQHTRMIGSADYLRENFHEVPAYIIACIELEMEELGGPLYPLPAMQGKSGSFYIASLYGSILPAVWSIMLALRARGLGSAWTTAHLVYEKETAALLGIPDHVMQAALLPVAYFKGSDIKPAKRRPVGEVTYWNTWGQLR